MQLRQQLAWGCQLPTVPPQHTEKWQYPPKRVTHKQRLRTSFSVSAHWQMVLCQAGCQAVPLAGLRPGLALQHIPAVLHPAQEGH